MKRRFQAPIFLLALAIAMVIKFAVHETEQLTEKTIEAKVTYNQPEGVIILDPVKEVEVRLRGRRHEIAQLNPIFVEVLAEIEQGQAGTVPIVLERSEVRTPGDFEVLSVSPNRFNVEVEPVDTAVLPIEAEIIGEPAAGAQLGTPTVRPAWAEVSGPASRVRQLQSLTAGPVSIERRAITFETRAPVLSDDPLIEVQPARVWVTVPLEVPELSAPIDELIQGAPR